MSSNYISSTPPKSLRRFLASWRYRIKTMVRYRLLFLTSAPIFLTLLALFGITLYWSLHYTWQSSLVDVTERLGVAKNSITILQQRQTQQVEAFSDSHQFHLKLGSSDSELKAWVSKQAELRGLDFLVWHPMSELDNTSEFIALSKQASFFDVLDEQELTSLTPSLVKRAEVAILEPELGQIETRGLVSRTVHQVILDGKLAGFIDGGILLNNSTDLVDTIRDLVYPSHNASVKTQGTVTLFLDDLRISTNVPLSSENSTGRAIGTRVSEEVNDVVLNQGSFWSDKAYVYDAWYVSAYEPIYGRDNQPIGMIYTGYLIWPLIATYLNNLVEITLTLLTVLVVSGWLVYRASRELFKPIETIHKVVKLVQLGKDTRIGKLPLNKDHELAQLASQFDTMLDQLSQRNKEIQSFANELETKVEVRTASLREKTEELEMHIELLNQTRDKLITSEKLAALGELTAGIAHEINNPTAVILGNLELMKFELGDSAHVVQGEIDTMLAQIDRIRNITKSLLQYSRHGGIQDEITWQHVSPVVDESITLVKTGSKRKDIKFETSLKATSQVEMNRHQFLQVLVNLQMNAIHSMTNGGTLTIESEDWCECGEECGAIIHIKDQGTGISADKLKRIFDPFYTTKRDGTGLGLSVSQSILSETGGEIRATSEVGKGSTFSVYFPAKRSSNGVNEALTIKAIS
ncbi:sensor histidine kinase [Vibrio maerlii]|uniref:sensor histidine kinase n=1 Tax=Vibrio maerlii TaxID=2231648 RepID=UPI001F12BA3A|nr:cache domain-containing protein [Vibrio maerlii]